ncbi:cysteine protease XCP1 [Olea europaea subsp. europaea]|uniref:Cysteine protease XCP1 n=1 Tax=Olea europaea subsp. europaea TaxID=158383 RepID=A0A8S0S276_OLEEU|nr:cysteine protease XCP1 [Olea europaea subsp. europaea]
MGKKEQLAINNKQITELVFRRENNRRFVVEESKSDVRDKEEKDEEYMDKICGKVQERTHEASKVEGRDFPTIKNSINEGVFDRHCDTNLDHGVTAVRYGSSKGLDYIIAKNSWGPKWGKKGYIRMKRNTGRHEGLSGINKLASYPTKTK